MSCIFHHLNNAFIVIKNCRIPCCKYSEEKLQISDEKKVDNKFLFENLKILED